MGFMAISPPNENGSPGARRMRKKLIVVTRRTTISDCNNRAARYRRTSPSSSRRRCDADAVAGQPLVRRDRPVSKVRPPAIGACHGWMNAALNRRDRRQLIQPDRRRVLNLDLERATHLGPDPCRIRRRHRAVEQRIVRRVMISDPILARRRGGSGAPLLLVTAGTGVSRLSDQQSVIVALELPFENSVRLELFDVDLNADSTQLVLDQHSVSHACLARHGRDEAEAQRLSITLANSIGRHLSPPK